MANLDDDYVPEDGMHEDAQYTLTPKGLLLACIMDSPTVAKHMNTDDINLMMNMTQEIWTLYENHCRKYYGKGENVGSIIFDSNGGHFNSLRYGGDGFEEDGGDGPDDEQI